jgi:hypothetical protein
MKRKKAANITPGEKPADENPKYFLADVPQQVRLRVLDLCFRRLWHEALELLRKYRFDGYDQDDLVNFYHWAPKELPSKRSAAEATSGPQVMVDYAQPAAEQIEDVCKRLAELPSELRERVHEALKHQPIDCAGSLLWKAGLGFTSGELCEYRKTLFPPNAMVDAYANDAPMLRPTPAERERDENEVVIISGPVSVVSRPSSVEVGSSAPTTADNPATIIENGRTPEVEPQNSKPEVVSEGTAFPQQEFDEVRQRLLQVLSLRAQPPAAIAPGRRESEQRIPDNGPLTTDNGPVATDSPATNPSIQQSINPVSGTALLTDLSDLISRYVVLPEMAAEALALWVVHTYAFTLRQITTYIGVVSPEKRCGKTTLLELLGLLAHEAIAAANISPSALFRVIEDKRPTLLIDEADTFLEGRDEMAGILNAGYRKGNAFVMRVSERKKPKDALARYSCWCPKVMAAIGRLPETLADRCILITMQRKMPGEKCERLRELDGTAYQQRCAEFVQQHSDALAMARPEIPAVLNDRAADIWEPLLAIADLAGGTWPELARQAALKLSSTDDEIPLIGYFLLDLRNWMLIGKTDRMLSRDIVAAFNRLHDRPWQDLRRGREINEYWLAAKMREFGIRPKHLRFGHSTGRGYLIEDIESALRRYIPNPDAHRQDA